MKKLLKGLLTLAACSAALCLTAAAIQTNEPAPIRVWGQVGEQTDSGILLSNDDPDDPFREVILQPGNACAVDAETGLPMDLESIQEGDTLYAWIGPAATMSLPPRVFPEVIVGNVAEGSAVPEYYKLIARREADSSTNIVFYAQNGTKNGLELPIPLDVEVSPWLTRQIIHLEDIDPGSQILVWRNDKDVVTKVLVFPYAYQGVGAWNADATGFVNGKKINIPGKIVTNPETGGKIIYLPLRAMAEAAGYDVHWDKNRGAVVQDGNVDLVFYAVPGEEVIFRNGGETGISAPCILENGVTYLPAEDLCYWLNLFFAADAE